ncbi:MAG: hypothetical protein QG650_302 [Patescibacteria group bacterium]|nr:hypothetical protein [Patescibacteria group bacterium]
MLRRYEHNLFDRILHYVFWGVSINILFFSSLVYAGMVSHLEESGNLGRDLAKAFPGGDAYGDQSYFFLFAFDYWGLLFVALFSILFAVKIPTIVRFLTDSLSKKTEK